MSLSTIDTALRGATVALLLVLAASLFRGFGTVLAGRLAAAFALGSAAHAVSYSIGATPPVSVAIHRASIGSPEVPGLSFHSKTSLVIEAGNGAPALPPGISAERECDKSGVACLRASPNFCCRSAGIGAAGSKPGGVSTNRTPPSGRIRRITSCVVTPPPKERALNVWRTKNPFLSKGFGNGENLRPACFAMKPNDSPGWTEMVSPEAALAGRSSPRR